jgi:hypothetical protein
MTMLETKAVWTTAYVNDLPDSAFLYIESGGEVDEGGKTQPRSLRHFPVRDASGAVDEAHARNAIGRIPQATVAELDAKTKEHLQDEARRLLDGVGKKFTVIERARAAAAMLRAASQPKPAAKVHRAFAGIPVAIDRPKGFVQEGKTTDGVAWRRVYHVDYGHIPDTLGGDGEGLDVFVGGDETAKEAHWILQRKADGSFDEYKCMLGFADIATAKAIYCAHIPKRFMGSIVSMPTEFMKALLGIEPITIEKALSAVHTIVDSVDSTELDQVPSLAQERMVKIAKAELGGGELRYVLGIVLEPETVDGQGDIYSADEIRGAAWHYMTHFRNIGVMHKGLVNGKVQLVESWIAPCDLAIDGSSIKAGSWLMGLHVVDDTIWQDVKRGELTGLSIGGFAQRVPMPTRA